MKIISINIGLPQTVSWQGKEVSTAIFKTPASGPLWVGKLNIAGDGQADLKVHGGVDKAVYAYSHGAYDWWEKELGNPGLPPGSFGENLTVSELDETKICIGDVFQLGECQLQVVQPRQPCFKLGIKFKDLSVLTTFNKSDKPGIYFRVLKEGNININDSLTLVHQEATKIPLIELFHFYKSKKIDPKRAVEILKIPNLNENWRTKLQKAAGLP